MAYFPLFLQLEKQQCLVAGGGRVALRKIRALREFGGEVEVVSPEIIQPILQMPDVICRCRAFQISDLKGKTLVIAATDEKEENHKISAACRERGILVNAVDQTEDCSFIFPAYIKQGDAVAAFSSGGNSPVAAQYMKRQMEPVLTEYFGNLTKCLGDIRAAVKEQVDISDRKQLYEEILRIGLEEDRMPEDGEIQQLIETYSRKSRKEIWTEQED